MKTFKKVGNIIIDILIIAVLIVSAFVVVLSVTSSSSGVPSIFGKALLSVQSESMVPTFEKGDLIIGDVTNDDTQLKVDDVITFKTTIQGYDTLNSHRITKIGEQDGIKVYYTKGDNNPVADEGYQTDATIVAVYNGTCLKGWGNALDFLRSQMGFFLVILLPMILFFIYEAIRVVRNIVAYTKEKAIADATAAAQAIASQNPELSDEQLKAAVQQYIAQNKNSEEIKETAAAIASQEAESKMDNT